MKNIYKYTLICKIYVKYIRATIYLVYFGYIFPHFAYAKSDVYLVGISEI